MESRRLWTFRPIYDSAGSRDSAASHPPNAMNTYVLLISLLVLCLAILAASKGPVTRSKQSENQKRPPLERNGQG